jgi:hypothetical protein
MYSILTGTGLNWMRVVCGIIQMTNIFLCYKCYFIHNNLFRGIQRFTWHVRKVTDEQLTNAACFFLFFLYHVKSDKLLNGYPPWHACVYQPWFADHCRCANISIWTALFRFAVTSFITLNPPPSPPHTHRNGSISIFFPAFLLFCHFLLSTVYFVFNATTSVFLLFAVLNYVADQVTKKAVQIPEDGRWISHKWEWATLRILHSCNTSSSYFLCASV